MAGENAHLDANSRPTLIFLANDGSGDIYNGQINPITGAIICEADVLSSNTSIGGTIPGGTAGSVLFLDIGGTLAQDNANFFYDPTNHFLGLGNDTPAATLDLEGTFRLNLGGDSTGDTYFRNSSGFIEALPIGTAGQQYTVVGGIPAWSSASSSAGYDTIETDGTPVTQRSAMNFSALFDVADSASPARTDIDIDVVNLANDTTFVDELVNNAYFTTSLANNANFYNTLANNTSFINALTSNSTFQSNLVTIINTAGSSIQIDLATQVTGILPLANGGTGQALSDPGYDGLMGWDDTDNSVSFFHIGSGLTYTHSTHTLSANVGSGIQSINGDTTVAQVITNGTGISISTVSGVTTITNTDPGSGLYSSGTVSYAGSGDITIPHGLGTTPTHIKVTSYFQWSSTGNFGSSTGTFDGTSTNTVFQNQTGATAFSTGTDTSSICYGEISTGTTLIRFSAGMDATNITLTKNASGSPTFYLLWEAYA